MKRKHRRMHIVAWCLLTPATAALLWLALEARPPQPANAALPESLTSERE